MFDVSGFYTRSGAKLYGLRVFDELDDAPLRPCAT